MGLKDEFEKLSGSEAAINDEIAMYRIAGLTELDRCFREFAQMMLDSEILPEPLGIGRVSSENQRIARRGIFKRGQTTTVETWNSTPIKGVAGWVLGNSTPGIRPKDDYEYIDTWVVPEHTVVTTEGLISWTIGRHGGSKESLGTLNPGMYLHSKPVAVKHAPQSDVIINGTTVVATQIQPYPGSCSAFQIWLREQDPQIQAPQRPGRYRTVPPTQWFYEAYQEIVGDNYR